jgi:hypothetical protein
MAGGFAVCGFAVDPFIFVTKGPASPETSRLRGTLVDVGLKKPFFQAISLAAFTLD